MTRDKAILNAWGKIVDFCKSNYANAWQGKGCADYHLFEIGYGEYFGVKDDGTPFFFESVLSDICGLFYGDTNAPRDKIITIQGKYRIFPTESKYSISKLEKVINKWHWVKEMLRKKATEEIGIYNFEV